MRKSSIDLQEALTMAFGTAGNKLKLSKITKLNEETLKGISEGGITLPPYRERKLLNTLIQLDNS